MRKGRVMRAAAILGIMLAAGSAAETKATESRMVLISTLELIMANGTKVLIFPIKT